MALEIRHPQTPIVRTLATDLSTDQRASTFPKEFEKGLYSRHPMILGQREYGHTKRIKRKMYLAHTSTLPFKDNRLRSQVATCASTLARTSNQFHSSWRPGPNHTSKMPMDPSLQRKGPGRGTPPLQAPNCKPSLLSKLTLAPATFSYLSTVIFTATMSSRQDTKTMMSSANAEIFARTLPVRKIPCRAGRALSSQSLRSRGSKVRR